MQAAGEDQGRHAVGFSECYQPYGGRAGLDDVVHQKARVNFTSAAVDVHSDGISVADTDEVGYRQGELERAVLGDPTLDAEYAPVVIEGLQRDLVKPAGGTLDYTAQDSVLLSAKD